MSIVTTRAQRRQLARDNAKQSQTLRQIPRSEWPESLVGNPRGPLQVWRSRDFLVQVYDGDEGFVGRLSVLRTSLDGDRWSDGITWDDLQRIKREVGFGGAWAVEVFPDDSEVVNIANIRHLWLLYEAPAFAWRRKAHPAP